QGDVDVDAFADELLDSWDAFGRGRDFDHDVRPVYGCKEPPCLGYGVFGVASQVGGDFQAYVAISSGRFFVEVGEEVAGGANVSQGQLFVDFERTQPPAGQLSELLIIIITAGNGCFKDGGVGSDPAQAILLNQCL